MRVCDCFHVIRMLRVCDCVFLCVSLVPPCICMGICICLHSNSCIFPTFVGGTSFPVCHPSFHHPLQLFSSNWIYIFIQQFIYDRTAHKPFFSRIFQLPMSYRPYFFLFNCLEWNQNARDSERWTIEAHAVVLRVQHRKCIFFHYGTRFPAVDLHCALWPNSIISADSAALVGRHWNLNNKKMRDREQKK